MKKQVLITLLVASISMMGIAQNSISEFVSSVEKTHQKEAFLSKEAITMNINVKFGGKDYLEGTLTQTTGGGNIKIKKKNGATIIFDGSKVYAKGIAADKLGGARFDIFTWSYFLGLPYKLNDGGTKFSEAVSKKWGAQFYNSAKLSFESGTGDAPDDWYVLYQNPETKVLEGAAYIVSYGKGKEAAEKEPHAIKYDGFKTVGVVPFPTSWSFHMWNEKEGYGKQIGSVEISNIQFITAADFSVPKNAILAEAP